MKTATTTKPVKRMGTNESDANPGFTMQLGNLTAGELAWLGQLTELMCDPARAAEWAAFKAGDRTLLYTHGALECVRPSIHYSTALN
ncbi:MAG: hypothetical protein FD161_3009 [Limisphaerales bacterium]|nr:MAG: hypothetical protein FD161_3009 [Limisphaerales bacterium]KAG0508122.1 MAG: hypothetical protein E1N63_2716 [Limisphaerales bacterium]TXT53025.1 MAG: hypothetical protein FD140_133 [Limisphaerales bacterium]